MKLKNVILAVACVMVSSASLFAQQTNCREIVRPFFGTNEAMFQQCPDDKIDWYCAFSRNSFFVADELPDGAPVYEISELKRVDDGMFVPSAIDIDLSKWSYYEYKFDEFRFRHRGQNIYFHTPMSSHPYLVLRPYAEALKLTNEETGQ